MTAIVTYERLLHAHIGPSATENVAIRLEDNEDEDDALKALRSHRPKDHYLFSPDDASRKVFYSRFEAKRQREREWRAAISVKSRETAARNKSLALPLARQRRCDFDWSKLVPQNIAATQIAWERGRTAKALVDAGLLAKLVAQAFGVSSTRIAQMTARYDRWVAAKGDVAPGVEFIRGLQEKPRVRVPWVLAA